MEEEQIKELFVKAVNLLITDAKEIIRNYEEVRPLIFDTECFDAEIIELQEEMTVTAELIQRCVDEIANRAIEAVRGNKKAASGETVKRFSIDPNFEKEYNEWVKNKKPSKKNFFVLGSTSKAMMDIGINPSKIRWYASKIKTIQEKHRWITDDVVKQIPRMLEYPILIMQSITAPNRIVVTGDIVI